MTQLPFLRSELLLWLPLVIQSQYSITMNEYDIQLYLNVNNVLLEYNSLYVYSHVIACRLECQTNPIIQALLLLLCGISTECRIHCIIKEFNVVNHVILNTSIYLTKLVCKASTSAAALVQHVRLWRRMWLCVCSMMQLYKCFAFEVPSSASLHADWGLA